MKSLKLNQKGVAHLIPIALVVLVVGVVAFAAYRIGSKESSKSDDNTVVVKKGEKKQPEEKKKTYEFEETGLKIDIPESWQVDIEDRSDINQDGKNDGYSGKIKAKNGWGAHFSAHSGGFGGGPGCNYKGEMPDEPACPEYTVNSNDVLQTKDVLISYSSKTANANGFHNNCTVIKDSNNPYNNHSNKPGETFEGTGWTCFGSFNVNQSIKDPTAANKPTSVQISVLFPYDLEKKASTDFLKDKDYQAVLEALKTLRNN